MRRLSTLAILALISAAAGAEETPVVLPQYESIPRIERYATAGEYGAARSDANFTLTRAAYDSDGLTVFAYVYRPKSPQGRLPVVVFNRGSFTWKEFAGEYLTMFHRLGKAGFVVVAPMLRGSGGAEGRDELGGADLADLMNTRALIAAMDFVDPRNIFMYGESRGGMMTYQAIRDGYALRAAATVGAFSDLGELTSAGGRLEKMAVSVWPDYLERRQEIDERRSAARWADRLRVPLLIMHGGADRELPPAQALALAAKLQAAGQPYELMIRAGANHVMTEWRHERDALAIEWFRRHMAE
jgi:dipeptidyl aminopeptidase/acylaminoacyl peptidase